MNMTNGWMILSLSSVLNLGKHAKYPYLPIRIFIVTNSQRRPASYSGYMDSGISVDPLTSYYGNNTCRLIEVKKKYDPKGFFENPMSIPTSSPDGIDCED